MAPKEQQKPGRSEEEIRNWIMTRIANDAKIPPGSIDPSAPFADFGLDSLRLVAMIGDLSAWLGRKIEPTAAWEYPTIDAFCGHVAHPSPNPKKAAR